MSREHLCFHVEDFFTSRGTMKASLVEDLPKSRDSECCLIKDLPQSLSIGGFTKSRDHAEPAGAEHRPSAADQDQQQGQPHCNPFRVS